MTKPLSVHEALIWVMVTTAVADRNMTESELDQFERLIGFLPVFQGFEGSVGAIADTCSAHLKSDDGIDRILDKVVEALPARLHETAYALAIEVAASDLDVRQEELVFLQMLEDRLELDKLGVAAIEHSARVRYRKL
ncbi:tellurite resistance TerB family protein [Oryzibacter oryziterrae]|uniref:tellurite resistance TerB family protein n=1 Tax=Oryzibacter oryziterrae TaxID=2766474 RepID=UPI001F22BFD3|nr:tellurite resistance TerB family protein [Oryzibacter oryziterrae]